MPAPTSSGFRALGIPPSIQHKVDKLGFVTPTPIQAQAIPPALQGRDLIGIAQTGTGKTLAFGVPMLANLRDDEVGLVLAPTRELALQIEETFRKLDVRTAVLIGGAPIHRQIQQFRARPKVIVATPGRLIDHLNQRTIDLKRVRIVVLDEADRMLDMGFAPAIHRILGLTTDQRQTMLFSATMPRSIEELAQQYLSDPMKVEVARAGTAAELVEQALYMVEKEDKNDLLGDLLHSHTGTVLVFTRTRHGAKKLTRTIRETGHTAAEIHSDRSLTQRVAALRGFKSGEYRVLVATDIAARGIDVREISLVVNYDVPEHAEDYVHRIGRTGRAGATGRAYTFASRSQIGEVRDIERLIKSSLPLVRHERERRAENPAPRPMPQGDSRPRPKFQPKPGPKPGPKFSNDGDLSPVIKPRPAGDRNWTPKPTNESEGRKWSPKPKHESGGKPWTPKPTNESEGRKWSPKPKHESGGKPWTPKPTNESEGRKWSPKPKHESGGKPWTPKPTNESEGRKWSPKPKHESSGKPWTPKPTNESEGRKWSPKPKHESSGKPWTPKPTNESGGKKWSPKPKHEAGGKPWTPKPTNDSSGKKWSPKPNKEATGKPSAGPAPAGASQGNRPFSVPSPYGNPRFRNRRRRR